MEVYCVCRTAEVDRFMIGCDHCEEWYHGDCITPTPEAAKKLQKEAKYIKKFYCKECKEKNPHLSTVYKSKYADKVKEEKEEEESKPKEKKKDKEHKDKHKDKHKEKHRDKERDKEKKKSKEKKKDKHRSKSRSRSRSKSKEQVKRPVGRPYDKHAHKHKHREKELEKEKPKAAEEEVETIDLRKTNRESVEEKVEPVKSKEEKEVVELVKPKSSDVEKERRVEQAQARRLEELRRERSLSTDKPRPAEARKVVRPETVNLSSTSEEEPAARPAPRPAVVKRKASKEQREERGKKRRRTLEAESSSSEEEVEVEVLQPRQCYGLECCSAARAGSKYCSDQCGIQLATFRIYQTLPERIREWNQTPCRSSETNQRELARIRGALDTARGALEETDRQVVELEAAITRSRGLQAPEAQAGDSSEEEDEQRGGQVPCVSCGKDVPSKTAIRHMETCFNKFESQTSYGSLHKTMIEGYQMVCDYYNPDTQTFCKRLRVICPEHTKDRVVGDTDLCGAPLVKNLFNQTGEVCRALKKDCSAHYCWEKLRRAELDLDRVRQWVKLDELMEQERSEKELLSRRAGVLNLMLHSTFNHEMMAKMMAESKAKLQAKPRPAQPAKRP